jgi:hypothetical protein
MMADETPKDPQVMDSTEMADMIRNGGGPEAVAPATEPDVIVEDEPKVERVPSARERPESTDVDTSPPDAENYRKALSTIEALQRDKDEALRRIAEVERRVASPATEPQVEMMEYMPGILLPKDESRHPVRFTPDNLKALGWEPDPALARGLSILGSALLVHVNNILMPAVEQRVQQVTKSREDVSRGTAAFFDAFPDLIGEDDFIALVEQGARQRDSIHQRYTGEDYTKEVARRVRTRIAGMRGQSYDDYINGLKTPQREEAGRRPVSRAVTTPSRRTGPPPRKTGDQAELDDLIDGR